MRTTHIEADVAVMGGGIAGVCAALAAARIGCNVVLVQDRPVLGGNASSEIRMHISGAEALMRRLKDGLDYRETGILEELKLEEAVHNPQRAAIMLDLTLWQAVRNEPNITLLLNTFCDGVEMEEAELPPANDLVLSGTHAPGPIGPIRRIVRAHATRPSTEEEFWIKAVFYIDSTGDGRLGAEAGADVRYGREGRDEFGESLAPVEKGDEKVLGSSLLFTARRHDTPVPFKAPSWARTFTEEDFTYRKMTGYDFGYWWIEWGGQLHTIHDNEAIRDELLAVVLGVWDHIKNSGKHDADHWAIDWIGVVPGKRESRRFYGDHILIQSDVQEAPLFPDRVAYGGWSIDVHVPEGIDRPQEPPNFSVGLAQPYSIPLRSLYSRNIVNMFMAGRNISASHVAFGSTRVMGTCGLMGQAAGTAAAVAALNGLNATRRCLDHPWLATIQQQLLRDDAYLIDLPGADPADLARHAAIQASSATQEGAPQNVVNGIARRTANGENMWISQKGFPQSLTLSWENPRRIGLVEVTLDTGLHRELRLSMSEQVAQKSIRGPQPETLSDLRIRLLRGDHVVAEQSISGNYQRKLRIAFDDATHADRVELIAEGAWEVDHARIPEVRVYEKPDRRVVMKG